ncbi:MAG: winged helix-turn-helix transcriptional regulator [Saprospiraceae bacterium]|nr:winged helix-turn-helix transcriptional regulator [Lewinellaceae bacterium]MBP6812749.1 winged helix-turn-helix transcriptional regulator [Saprospiraceae bacterium]
MLSVYFFKMMRFLPLLVLPVLAWLMPAAVDDSNGNFSPDKINLALRRTADGLLRLSGDSTSRIPAIEQCGVGVWRVRLEQDFQYDALPALLQASLELYDIRRPYEVAVRRCADATIDLGYHQQDYLENTVVACGGRTMPDGCHFIEISFLEEDGKNPFWIAKIGFLILFLIAFAGFWYIQRGKTTTTTPLASPLGHDSNGGGETNWLTFGNSRLDVAGQVLLCNGVRHALTFRETKLLRLFVSSPDRLLERDFILQQVWADEGVLVGRSVDVFVSRLRKKLAADPTVGLVAVHGVGYRMETGK